MKGARPQKRNFKAALAVVGAGAVIGGAFVFASGEMIFSSDSLFAAVFNSLSSKPAIVVSKSGQSPSASIKTGAVVPLAVFDVATKNVTFWTTLRSSTYKVEISGSAASTLKLSDFKIVYRYCMPSSPTYGYGYRGGNCGTKELSVNNVQHNGNTYTIFANGDTRLYPGAVNGQVTVSAKAQYTLGGTASSMAQVRVSMVSASASGDQCKAYSLSKYPKTYGYSGCVPLAASMNSASANTISVQRSYGYGYCLI